MLVCVGADTCSETPGAPRGLPNTGWTFGTFGRKVKENEKTHTNARILILLYSDAQKPLSGENRRGPEGPQ